MTSASEERVESSIDPPDLISIIAAAAKLFSPFDSLSRISIQTESILQELYYETFNFKVWSLRGLFVEL